MRREEIVLVIDTNVWISYLLTDTPEKYQIVFEHPECSIYICDELIDEIREVANRDKFRRFFTIESVDQLIHALETIATNIRVDPEIQATDFLRDRDDAFLLVLAGAINADYLITGDKDLLILGRFGKTKIVTISQFREEFRNSFEAS